MIHGRTSGFTQIHEVNITLPESMTLSDPWPGFQDHSSFQNPMSQNGAFYTVQLQIIHLINLQRIVPLTHGLSVIAESLVFQLKLYISTKNGRKVFLTILQFLCKHCTRVGYYKGTRNKCCPSEWMNRMPSCFSKPISMWHICHL